MGKLVILERSGWVDMGNNQSRFSTPDGNDNVMKVMLGIREEEKPIINESKLSANESMIYNMVPELRQFGIKEESQVDFEVKKAMLPHLNK